MEDCFGWLTTIAQPRELRHRGVSNCGMAFAFAAAT
jgi:hypothetical protein